jgi:hypothetical protein
VRFGHFFCHALLLVNERHRDTKRGPSLTRPEAVLLPKELLK